MPPQLTYTDPDGTTRLRPGGIPLVIALICVPIVLAMLVSVIAVEGSGLGVAAGAVAMATLIVLAVRARPRGKLEVAAHRDEGRRVLVVATAEPTPEAAARVAELAGDAADVRLLVPIRSRKLDRWLSAEDPARTEAEARLAHSAGALVAAGLPVSGSVGDSDPGQALEDELRGYPADEVILLAEPSEPTPLGEAGERLGLPLERVET